MVKAIQAKHLDDMTMLVCLDADARSSGGCVSRWAFGEKWYPDKPDKVVLAKLRALVKRGLVEGCPCGCAGAFSVTEAGREMMFAGHTPDVGSATR